RDSNVRYVKRGRTGRHRHEPGRFTGKYLDNQANNYRFMNVLSPKGINSFFITTEIFTVKFPTWTLRSLRRPDAVARRQIVKDISGRLVPFDSRKPGYFNPQSSFGDSPAVD